MPPNEDQSRRAALLELAEIVGEVGSWDWIPSRGELIWSDNLYRLYGFEPGAIEPALDPIRELIHPDDRARMRATIEQLLTTGEPRAAEYRIVLAQRGLRYLRATVAVVERRDGIPWRLVGSVQDVTDQRRAEREVAAHLAIAHALTDWRSFDASSTGLVRSLAEAIDFDAGVIWVRRDDVLEPRAYWHAATVDTTAFERATMDLRPTEGSALVGESWRARAPLSLDRVKDDPRFRLSAEAATAGLRAAVAFPAISGDEVLAVVELLSTSEAPLSERMLVTLTGIGYELGQFLAARRGELRPPLLTRRELEVLQLAANGLAGPEIAAALTLSPATVKTHFEHIYVKLGVSDRAGAVGAALRLALIS